MMALSGGNIAMVDGSDIQLQSVSHRDYSLNLDKALRKKLQAAKRQHVEYMVKDGGIVANMDAVSFEIFRFSCQQYYSSPVDQIQKVKTDNAKDTRGNIVQVTYTVILKEATTYTLNMYLTRCSLLINGKATQHFINEDLSTIHQIMSQVTIQGMKVDIKKLNALLADQMQKLLDNSNFSTINGTPKACIEKSNISKSQSTSNIECQKCKRNCKKRAVQCDVCDRWSHYNCERLSDDVVKLIEGSKDYTYRCTLCKKSSPVKHRLMIPALSYSPENTVPKTLSESILSDEMGVDCVLCCEPLNNNEVSCEKCSSVCHYSCMSPLNTDICQACMATDEQISQHHAENLRHSSSIFSKSDIKQGNKSPRQVSQSDENEKLVIDLKQREADLSAKQRELRQLEMKVRKKEDEIRLKEAKIKEYEKNSGKLESKIESLEFRNKELEHTISNLQERLTLFEGSHTYAQRSTYSPPAENPGISQSNQYSSKARCDDLIQGIHDRVSAYVLLKVEKQIERLIDLDGDSSEVPIENSAQMDTGHTVQINPGINTFCQSKDKVTSQDGCPEPNLLNGQTVRSNSSYYPASVIDSTSVNQYCPVESHSVETFYSPQNQTLTRNSVQQQECLNVPLINDPQYVMGQPLYSTQQEPVTADKCKKRFLRHSNLIRLVN